MKLLGNVLAALGFEVTIIEDADKPQLQTAVIDFCTTLEEAGTNSVALIYFAGHGIQHSGTNYIVPVKADIPSTRHLNARALAVDEIVGELVPPIANLKTHSCGIVLRAG